MAPEDFEIIGQLLLRAGIIMEDRSPELITRLEPREDLIMERVEVVKNTGRDLLALAAAAQTILRAS